MTTFDDVYAYRQAVLTIIENLRANAHRDGKQMTHRDLAKLAWPNVSDPDSLWRDIRKRGRVLGVEDVRNIAIALGTTPSFLSHLAEEELKHTILALNDEAKNKKTSEE